MLAIGPMYLYSHGKDHFKHSVKVKLIASARFSPSGSEAWRAWTDAVEDCLILLSPGTFIGKPAFTLSPVATSDVHLLGLSIQGVSSLCLQDIFNSTGAQGVPLPSLIQQHLVFKHPSKQQTVWSYRSVFTSLILHTILCQHICMIDSLCESKKTLTQPSIWIRLFK